MEASDPRAIRVAPVLLPDDYRLPGPPAADASPTIQDTYRQTRFLLRADLKLFEQAMNVQLQVLRDSHPARYRTQPLAALAIFWSRAFAAMRDAMALLTSGSYPSVPHLVRSAAECIGVQGQLRESEMDVYEQWLANALQQDREHQALDLNLGRYRAAGILASDAQLGEVYRVASDLSMTPFGGSLLLTAPESNLQRILVAFADQAFHAGFAELEIGWLLRLCERQLHYLLIADDIFNVTAESRAAIDDLRPRIQATLAQPNRCRIETVEAAGERRYLVLNFRRAASGAAKKLIL
ncbi:MAG: hypothetical protein WEB00_00835 [Dehalococcoidia bacterium]